MKKSKGDRLNWKHISEIQKKPKTVEGKKLSEEELKNRGNNKPNY